MIREVLKTFLYKLYWIPHTFWKSNFYKFFLILGYIFHFLGGLYFLIDMHSQNLFHKNKNILFFCNFKNLGKGLDITTSIFTQYVYNFSLKTSAVV